MNFYFRKSLALISIIFMSILLLMLRAFADNISHTFSIQNASGTGSSNSIIGVDSNLLYINKGDNSSIVGNYFSGYYYDSILGYFEVDYLPNPNENVRIVGSTGACPTGYGYRLGGYAYSEYFGFIDFDYNSDVFVYYCVSDSELHGYAYSESNGFQNFEGITFPINPFVEDPNDIPTSTGTFVNDSVNILDTDINGGENPPGEQDNSNFTPKTIQNNTFQFEVDKENLFYIIK